MEPLPADQVRAAQAGDREALRHLLERAGPVTEASIAVHAGRDAPREDLLQETFVRICRGIGDLRDPERFESWVYGIARRVAQEWRRDRARNRDRTDSSRLDSHPAPAPSSPQGEETGALGEAVESLPEEHRETLVLFYARRRSYREIAALQGITPAAVNQRLTRARRMLRETLGGMGLEP